ncbi:MAG: 2-oxoacid:acceptor oxidoreductase subunit alpha [Chloroflexi bacterium]|nr:2-oxoacid:acceptor oxidoreductase subunit alpha [Chloroflexota bacterium]
MVANQVSWMVGGPQGSGINAAAEILAKACSRGGLAVFSNIEYHSNIIGKHSFYRVRAGDGEIRSHVDEVHLLVALDKETLLGKKADPQVHHIGHLHQVVPQGGVIYDAALDMGTEEFGRGDLRLFPLPFLDLIEAGLRAGGKEGSGTQYQIMKNTVLLGATVALLDYDLGMVTTIIGESFTGRKAHLAHLNVEVARVAYAYVKEHFPAGIDFHLRAKADPPKQILIRGVVAAAIGKLKAGCGFQSYYPITPATDESFYLEARQADYDITVFQCEDEISSINMAVGAAYAGARSATSTSGPGLALMGEGLGFASITETAGPVVCLYQRGGPSTGLPTRTEQGDLHFALHPAHGEFEHIVVAPGDAVECFYATFEAFNWADRYQMPVIVLQDKFVANSYRTAPWFDTSGLTIDRGARFDPQTDAGGEAYRRYRFTASGVSPRSRPGQPGGMYRGTSDEHDPFGHIHEGIENRMSMVHKRRRKLALAAQEIPDEMKFQLHGPPVADVTLVSWGSPKGAILDAMAELSRHRSVNFLQVRLMRPFPVDAVARILREAKRSIAIEGNFSGQLTNLIREQTGVTVPQRIVRFDGRPFSQGDIVESVEKALATGDPVVELSHI